MIIAVVFAEFVVALVAAAVQFVALIVVAVVAVAVDEVVVVVVAVVAVGLFVVELVAAAAAAAFFVGLVVYVAQSEPDDDGNIVVVVALVVVADDTEVDGFAFDIVIDAGIVVDDFCAEVVDDGIVVEAVFVEWVVAFERAVDYYVMIDAVVTMAFLAFLAFHTLILNQSVIQIFHQPSHPYPKVEVLMESP
jgi:hypothetical protein